MTNHIARLYAFAGAILVFLLTWAVVAAHPWQSVGKAAASDPRLAQLQLREERLRHEQVRVQRIVDRRWARYRKALAARKKEIAAAKAAQQATLTSTPSVATAPSVSVVTLPPLTSTQTS